MLDRVEMNVVGAAFEIAVIASIGSQSIPDFAFCFIRASVTGLDESIPFLRYPLAGDVLLYGIGARPSPDGVHKRIGRRIYGMRDHILRCVDNPDGGLT
jgi:hypothetical protein